jgi:putative ABC transport system ATP-binding protein
MKILSKLNEEGTTIIMVTHSDEMAGFCDTVVELLDGRIVTK